MKVPLITADRALPVALLCFFAMLAPASAGATGAKDASLTVRVTGLPPGTAAVAQVSGPSGFRATLARTRSFGRLAPGTYRVRLSPVRIRRGARGVPAGSEAFPAKRVVSVRLRPHRHAAANAAYGTIRSSAVDVLRGPAIGFDGAATDPSAIVLRSGPAAPFEPGSIIAAGPSKSLPHGLFHRVTAIEKGHGRVTLSLAPASLSDAFPGLDLDATVPLSTTPDDGARASSALSAVDLSFSKELIDKKLKAACGLPPSGWHFSPSASIRPSLKVDIHRRYLVVPYGELSLEVDGNLGIDATVPAGVHCDLVLEGPALQGVVPVAGVPVPVEGGVDLAISVRNGDPIGVTAQAGLKVTGGISFDGPKTKPVFKFKPSGSGSVDGANGEIEIGPRLQAGIGVIGGNAHVEIDPRVAGAAKASGCEILLRASIGAGLDLGSFHPSINSPNLQKQIYRCPAKSGGGDGGSTPARGATTGHWSIGPAPNGSGTLYGVSCPTASFCMAVGNASGSNSSLAATWNGSTWSVVPPPGPNPEGDSLYAVDCRSASFCIAVGGDIPSATALIERWDGSSWSKMSTPAVSAASLSGISCVGMSWCMAAGRTETGGGVPLVEHWDGANWSTQSVPTPPSSDRVDFSSVACASQSSCEAVGSYDNDQGVFTGTAFADHWNGSSWGLGSAPATAEAAFSGLAGVDCASSAFCAAVGYFDRGLGTHAFPLADVWNGGSWSNTPAAPLAAGAIGGETVNVACPAVGTCIAVGNEYDGAHARTLAMAGNGSTWALEPTPAVTNAEFAELEDVSCPSVSTCFAVGDWWEAGTPRPLVEQRSG